MSIWERIQRELDIRREIARRVQEEKVAERWNIPYYSRTTTIPFWFERALDERRRRYYQMNGRLVPPPRRSPLRGMEVVPRRLIPPYSAEKVI